MNVSHLHMEIVGTQGRCDCVYHLHMEIMGTSGMCDHLSTQLAWLSVCQYSQSSLYVLHRCIGHGRTVCSGLPGELPTSSYIN